MRLRKLHLAALAALAVAIAPATSWAQATPPRTTPPPSPAADDDFIVGLRRIGVMAGQAIECTPEAQRSKLLLETLNMGQAITAHFGLNAAFNFTGAVGYGSGKPFDKAGCPQAVSGWADVVKKYTP